jgi:hypothetical protein
LNQNYPFNIKELVPVYREGTKGGLRILDLFGIREIRNKESENI